jgi:glycosyltransferase involved in cell wall biosynthesis
MMLAGSGGFHQEGLKLPGAGLLPGLLTIGQAEIAWIAHRCKLELVHDPTGSVPLGLVPASKVATIHDVVPYVYPETSTFLDRFTYRAWLPYAVQQLDAAITVSQQSKEDIAKYLHFPEEKILVIPEAANTHYRALREEEIQPALERASVSRPYILYVGSIEPRKNLVRLLQAYSQLREWSPKWRLVIVGARNFWKSSPVKEAVEQLGLGEWVRFTGYVPEEDLPALYNGADLFVFPSLYEGFGLPVLEAMACGTPVVTSNSSSLPEVAGEAALLVDPYSVDEIAASMRRVLEDPELAAELRARGLERVGQFSWERTARETIAVYEQVLDSKKK